MDDETVFDLSQIMVAVADDRELAAQVIGVFLSDIPTQLADLEAAIKQKDAATAQRVAHSIKGASATVGAEELRSVAFEGELLGRDGRLDELEALVPEIRERFTVAARAMREAGFEECE